jgi:hypothetical protein
LPRSQLLGGGSIGGDEPEAGVPQLTADGTGPGMDGGCGRLLGPDRLAQRILGQDGGLGRPLWEVLSKRVAPGKEKAGKAGKGRYLERPRPKASAGRIVDLSPRKITLAEQKKFAYTNSSNKGEYMKFSFRRLPLWVTLCGLLLPFLAFPVLAQTAPSDPPASTDVPEWLSPPDGCSVTCQGSAWACCNLISKGGCHCWDQTSLPSTCASGGAHASACSVPSAEAVPVSPTPDNEAPPE